MGIVLQCLVYGLTLAALYLPLAIGLNVIFGVMGILNFAHGELYMLGAVSTWWLVTNTGLGFFPSVGVSMVLVAVLAVLFERVLLKPLATEHLAALIVCMGFSSVLQTTTLLVGGSDTKHYPFPFSGLVNLAGTNVSVEKITVTILALVAVAIFYLLLQKTKLGRSIRALAQDKQAATLQGINPTMIVIAVMALGTALAAMSGGLAGAMFGVEPFMGADFLMYSFVIIVLGGLGSTEGALVAAVLLGFVQSFVTIYIGASEAAMAGFIALYVVLMLRPHGLFGRARAGMF